MNSGVAIELVRQNYQKITDEELVRVATQDAVGLTPEAQEVVRQEIEKRKLDPNIVKGVQAQNLSYSTDDVDAYCKLIQDLNCPVCGSSSEKLNATLTAEVVSYIFVTHYKKRIKVACPKCLDKANNVALLKSATLGWWGIPWGIVRSIQSIIINLKNKRKNHTGIPNESLKRFALSKIGQLETYKDNKEKLQQIIATS